MQATNVVRRIGKTVRKVQATVHRSLALKAMLAVCLVTLASASGVFADSATEGSYNINWNNNSYCTWPARVIGDGSTGVSNAPYATNVSLQGGMSVVGPYGGYCSFSRDGQTTNGATSSDCAIDFVNGFHTAQVDTTHAWNAYGLNTTRTKSTFKNHP